MDVAVHQFDGVSTLSALPLAAGLLVASARKDERLAKARFRIQADRPSLASLFEGHPAPDVIAFSAYVWNERFSLEAARRARARFPSAFILFGGPSVPRRPDRLAAWLRDNPSIDALAIGEGEHTFRELLAALAESRPLDGVAGLALREKRSLDGVLRTANRDRIRDFTGTASPYLDGTFDTLVATRGKPVGAAILETNRGCPFACTYCDWGQAIASAVHELPTERIEAELDWIAARGIPYLYIVDANYGIRRRDLALVQAIGALRKRAGNPQYVFFHLTKNAQERHLALVQTLVDAGVSTHLALSAQDFEPRVLEAVKRDNIRLDRALELRRLCHERGIPTLNELILGLPEQTYASFADGMMNAVTPFPRDTFQLYLARLLENAEMASPEQRARYGIETREVSIASFHRAGSDEEVPEIEEVVVATRAMPLADWRRAFRFGYLLAAGYNLRLLDVVMQTIRRATNVSLRAFLELLLEKMAGDPPDTPLGAVGALLDRYASAVVDGRAMVLPFEGLGAHLWPVEDALLIQALRDGERLYAAIEEVVRAGFAEGEPIAEAVRWQALVTPRFSDRKLRTGKFSFDFQSLHDNPIDADWTLAPSLAAARTDHVFVLTYLGAVNARLPTGTIRVKPPAR